jgi:hypothetical protein
MPSVLVFQSGGTFTVGAVAVSTLGEYDNVKLPLGYDVQAKRSLSSGKVVTKKNKDDIKMSFDIRWFGMDKWKQSVNWSKQDTAAVPLPVVIRLLPGEKSAANPEFTFNAVWEDPGEFNAQDNEEFTSTITTSLDLVTVDNGDGNPVQF